MSAKNTYEYYNNSCESWEDEIETESNPNQCVEEVRDPVKNVEMQTELNLLNPKYDYKEFPTLGHVQGPNVGNLPKPNIKTSNKMDKNSRGKVLEKLCFGNKPWLEERRDARKSYSDKFKNKKEFRYSNRNNEISNRNNEIVENRSAAFELLANKDSLDDKLNKTQMCNSVGKSKCHHKNCRFAHSLDELKFSNCLFGDRCRFILVNPNGYAENIGNKKCVHKHPCENENDFITRTGLERYKAVEPVETSTAIVVQKKNDNWVDKSVVKDGVEPLEVVVHKKLETILRVPQNLAIQSIELAMKSGVTNIRLEIIQNS